MENSIEISTEDDSYKDYELESAQQLVLPFDEKVSFSNDKTMLDRGSSLKTSFHSFQVTQRIDKHLSQPHSSPIPKTSSASTSDYPISNLTLTLYLTTPLRSLVSLLVTIGIAIRVYLIVYIILTTVRATEVSSRRWDFAISSVCVFIASRLLYVCIVLRISLCTPITAVERVLKHIWNRQEVRVNEAFEYITFRKLIRCLKMALIPPEMSWIYITQAHPKHRAIYCAINYINMSIEGVLCLPLAIYYNLWLLQTQEQPTPYRRYTQTTLGVSIGWALILLCWSGCLLLRGWRLRQEKV